MSLCRVLVTGATGFAGGHLVELLLDSGAEVIGVSRRGVWPSDLAHLSDRVKLIQCNLQEAEPVLELIRSVSPDRIYHLAGFADVGASFRDADTAWRDNFLATRNLYDAITRTGMATRVLYVSSGLVYGDAHVEAGPLTETSPLRPPHPYGTSKAAADLLSFQVTCFPGLDVVRVRPFNHIGPRQSPRFAIAHFAQQIAAIEKGLAPPVLHTGDLRARRDFTDVRDVARAYFCVMEQAQTGEVYNVASQTTYSIGQLLQTLLSLARTDVKLYTDPALLRPSEPSAVDVCCRKICGDLGWTPTIPIEQSLRDSLDYFRAQHDPLRASRSA